MTRRENALEKVVALLDEEVAAHQHELPVTLLNGLAGLSIFYHSYSRLTKKEKYVRLAEELSDSIIHKLNDSNDHPFRISHRFSTGLAGVSYTFWHLSKYQFIDFDHEESFSSLDEYLVQSAQEDYNAGICDFLHGPIGILYYFIKQYPDRDVRIHLDKLLDLFLQYSKRDEKGLRAKNMILEDIRENEYDLSLAHGLCGIMLVLNECIRNKYEQDKVKEIIHEIATYILRTEKPLEKSLQNSLFPTSLNEDLPDDHKENLYNHRSRLAWCYGDLNIAWSFIKTGKQLGWDHLYQKGLEVGLSTLGRKAYLTHQIGDVFFCHGSSGVAHLYKRLYQETGNESFREAYDHWLNETVDDILNETPQWTNRRKFSVLEGLVGLGFVLLPETEEKEVHWEEIFLLQ